MPQLPKRFDAGMLGRSRLSLKREAVAMSALPVSTGTISWAMSAGLN
jgi:hypothetical protein